MSRSNESKTEDLKTGDLIQVEEKSQSIEKQMDGSNIEVDWAGGRSQDCPEAGITQSGVEGLKLCNSKDVEMECEYSDSKENEISLDVYLREAKLERERNLVENRRLLMEMGLITVKQKKVPVKRKKVNISAPRVQAATRKSSRQKASVDYSYPDEWDDVVLRRRRKGDKIKEGKVEQRRSVRNVLKVDYAKIDPNLDELMYCEECKEYVVIPCPHHGDLGLNFVANDCLQLEVGQSQLRRAGDGLWNRGPDIVKGTMLGPYTGQFIPKDWYATMEQQGIESGNAWIVYDSETMETAKGFIDPGRQPDGKEHILSKANCPNYRGKQNVEAIQFKGEIYYRVIKDILQDTEIFVRYGEDYEAELGIDPATANTYKGKEDHTTVAVPCYKCNTNFASQDLLQLHLYPASGLKSMCSGLVEERMLAREGRKYWCHFCTEYFISKNTLTTHIDNCHSGRKHFMCNICNQTFISSTGLYQHKSSKHEKRIVHCIFNECNKEFSRRADMMIHYKKVHLKVKDYKCPVCGVLFGDNSNLKRHIQAVHEGKYPHKCEFENCTKSFTRSENLRRHVTAVHMKIKSYVCEYEGCGKRFGYKGDLTKHEALHSDKKRFKCPYECSFATIGNSYLAEHIRNKHRVEEVIDRACDSLLLPFVCKEDGCIKRFATDVECRRHRERLH